MARFENKGVGASSAAENEKGGKEWRRDRLTHGAIRSYLTD